MHADPKSDEERMSKGFFITVEGIDGIGKSTQLELLLAELQKSYKVYFTKEPGDAKLGSGVGAGVRDLLFKKPGTANLGPGVGDLLFLADHLQNIYELKQHLAKGEIVVSDRYADSQFAYSASASKRAPAWAHKLWVEQYGLVPDITILLLARGPVVAMPHAGPTRELRNVEDISWALRRANARRGVEAGKQEGKAWNDAEEQRLIQNAYLIGLKDKNRTRIIDVYEEDTVDEIQQRIQVAVLLALNGQDQPAQPLLPLVSLPEVAVEAA